MLACFTSGAGLDGRGSKRQRMRRPQDGCGGSYLANPTAGARARMRVFSRDAGNAAHVFRRHRGFLQASLL